MRGFRYGLIVLVLGTIAACTSDGDPKPTDTPRTAVTSPSSTSAKPTPTTTPSPSVATTGPNVRPGEMVPVLPALAKTNSRPGAAAFAYYWFQALDWGYATTDSTLAKSLYLPQCAACVEFMKNFDETRVARQHFRGGRISLESRAIVPAGNKYPDTTAVDVVFSVAALDTLDAGNSLIGTDPAQKSLRYRLRLQWSKNGWAVRDYDRAIAK